MEYTLREYQRTAVNKILWAVNNKLEGNSIVVLPTGAGKSLVIANVAKELDQPILILQPSKEILEQNHEKLAKYIHYSEIGIYSASMDQKNIGRYTLATIQSIYKCPEDFNHFKLVIIDECDLLNPKNLDGMFTKFLSAIGNPTVIGLTATPYRQDTKYVYESAHCMRVTASTKLINRMKGFFWKRILFNINVRDLMEQGYLCPLEYIDRSLFTQEETPVNKGGTDFDLAGYLEKMKWKRMDVIATVKYAQTIAKSIIVFCSSVKQAEDLADIVEDSVSISAKTNKSEREFIINSFKEGIIKIVFNVGVLTTGFDHPALDCIILARPTRSIRLYYQMVGRGVRKAEGKTSCKIIDLTSTVKNLGRVETIKLVKEDKWELVSETGSWHDRELFDYRFSTAPSKKDEIYEKIKSTYVQPTL